ncbi:alpha/beta hydrolase [Sinorhizobium meliloti CCBAU 01290]|nr:alpha/beta hydrolase [Sinorhizobium meliloti CCBAU 01290]
MPEIIFNGPAGRLEGRYQPSKQKSAPIAIILHPHPQFGGTMNNQIVYQLFYMFQKRGFTTLRFNFRGIGRSQGEFDHGAGELSDAASALDWVQSLHPDSKSCWVAGYSFGAWIGMQLLMRRPEIEGFMAVAPQPNIYDFSFLAPCPSSGLIINGDSDKVAPEKDVNGLVEKLKAQKGILITHKTVPGANHFFNGQVETLMAECEDYLDRRLNGELYLSRQRSAFAERRRPLLQRCSRPDLLLSCGGLSGAESRAFETTVSTKGQVILPRVIRQRLEWDAGTRLIVEETPDGAC